MRNEHLAPWIGLSIVVAIVGLVLLVHSCTGREEAVKAKVEMELTMLDVEARASIVDRWLTEKTEEGWRR